MVHAWANGLGALPGLWGFEIRIPEGPCSALRRASGIDSTFARRAVEEGTVSVRKLSQRNAAANHSSVMDPHFAERQSFDFGDLADFFIRHPDDARVASATISALRTFKPKPFVIPGRYIRHINSFKMSLTKFQLKRLVEHTVPCRETTGQIDEAAFLLAEELEFHPFSHQAIEVLRRKEWTKNSISGFS